MEDNIIKIIIDRHLSITRDGIEIYHENLYTTGSLEIIILKCKYQLRALRRTVPNSEWSAAIETLWRCNSKLRRQTLNIDTDEITEMGN